MKEEDHLRKRIRYLATKERNPLDREEEAARRSPREVEKSVPRRTAIGNRERAMCPRHGSRSFREPEKPRLAPLKTRVEKKRDKGNRSNACSTGRKGLHKQFENPAHPDPKRLHKLTQHKSLRNRSIKELGSLNSACKMLETTI